MASLSAIYSDIETEVARFLGMDASPSGDDQIVVDLIIKRGVRRFLIPAMPDRSPGRVWSTSEPTTP